MPSGWPASSAASFTPLVFDVTQEDQVRDAAARVADKVGAEGLWGLVNNAGISRPGPLSEIPASAVREHLEVNVMGVVHVTKAFLPTCGGKPGATQRPGRIVNISSVSGRIAYPFMGPYAASKHALEALSDSWRRELMLYGVDVIVIEPGAIQTPIWDKAATISSEFAASDFGPILREHRPAGEQTHGLARRKRWRASSVTPWAAGVPRPGTPFRTGGGILDPAADPAGPWLDRVVARTLGMERKRDGEP